MARVFIEGFEHNSLANWQYGGNVSLVNASTYGMDGSYAVQFTDGYIYRTLETSLAEIWLTMWVYPKDAFGLTQMPLITFYGTDFTTILGRLTIATSDKKLYFWKGDYSSAIAVGTTVCALTTLYKIEIRYKPHLTAGNMEVRINGAAAEISSLGVSTSPVTQNVAMLLVSGIGANMGYWIVDNIIVDNAEYPGILSKIIGIVPNANGSLNEWTPSTGDNYTCVDEQPPSATDYVTINVNDKTELYAHAGVPGAVYLVKALQLAANVVKQGSSTPSNIQLAIKPGSTVRVSSSKAVPIITGRVLNIWNTNPDTGIAFTVEEINSLQMGVVSKA